MFGVYIFLYIVYEFIIKFYIDKVDAVVVDFLDEGCLNENGDGCWLGRKQPSTFDYRMLLIDQSFVPLVVQLEKNMAALKNCPKVDYSARMMTV